MVKAVELDDVAPTEANVRPAHIGWCAKTFWSQRAMPSQTVEFENPLMFQDVMAERGRFEPAARRCPPRIIFGSAVYGGRRPVWSP